MSIPSYQELRSAVTAAGEQLRHPTKDKFAPDATGGIAPRHQGKSPAYGPVVYYGDGAVGVKVGGKYLVARGDDHQDSMLALAHHIGACDLDNGVEVDEVAEADFYARCLV